MICRVCLLLTQVLLSLLISLRPQLCPMNTSPHVNPHKSGHGIWEEFSHSFTPAVREVVEFAKRIPGFRDLSQHDQVSLLKAGTFEVKTRTLTYSILKPLIALFLRHLPSLGSSFLLLSSTPYPISHMYVNENSIKNKLIWKCS